MILISLPLYSRLLRPGIHTTHDYHVFRQQQFSKCIEEFVFPCRWSPDSGFGYGEPVFNYYGQLPYMVGQIFKTISFSNIDAVKATFIMSLLLSGISMYVFSKNYWNRSGAWLSSLAYMYAPYRAVDVWVRGALPESLAFIFFPLIFLFITKKKFIWLGISLAGLAITHNLSLFMFLPFIFIWTIINYRRDILRYLPQLFLSLLIAAGLSAFYLLPVLFEKNLVTVNLTTTDYYQFQLHFATLNQLFLSRFWGYGGSTWGPNDSMSFSVGHIHWILLIISLMVSVLKKQKLIFYVAGLMFLVSVFLTHGKSEFIWKLIPGMPFLQFPWRYLTLAVFFSSFVIGNLLSQINTKYLASILCVAFILFNVSNFKEDIWQPITDTQLFSGNSWDKQRASTVQDYWPSAAKSLPVSPAPDFPQVVSGNAVISNFIKNSHSAQLSVSTLSENSKIALPITYFPGWTLKVNNLPQNIISSTDLNLISFLPALGESTVSLKFENTLPRSIGNGLSLISILTTCLLIYFSKKYDQKYI